MDRSLLKSFARDEAGSMVVFGLMLAVCMFIVGGVAVDITNAYQNRTHLQVAADSAAHAALVTRELKSPDEAKTIAIEVAQEALPYSSFGDTIQPADIRFGYWDRDARVFTPDPNSNSAVMVETARLEARANPEHTYMLRFVGLDSWDVRSQSVFETYYPTCLREGFVAEDVVEVTSNNYYASGFCIHSNTHVDLNNGSTFETGAIVSMPDRREIVGPANMYSSNPGLSQALRDGSYILRIVKRIQDIIAGVQDPNSTYYRDYIVSSEIIPLKRNSKLDGDAFTEGRIHRIDCSNENQSAAIHNGTILRRIVIVTNCRLNFGAGVALEDAVVVNSSTNDNSFGAASGVRLGKDDECEDGGGAQLVTMGGVNIPASLQMFGGQILAAKDVSFTALADGIEGASIVAGGRIDGTSNSSMSFCNNGMEDNFEAAYFRLAG